MKARAVVVAAGLVLALAGTAGCSGDTGEDRSPTPTPKARQDGPPAVAMKPPKKALKNLPAKADDVRITQCRANEGGGMTALGTVRNSSAKKRTYKITVVFSTDDAAAKTMNWAATRITVPGKASAPWVAEKRFGSDSKLTCTIAAVS